MASTIERLQIHHPGPLRLIPEGDAGIEVGMPDRIFENYLCAWPGAPDRD